MALQVESTVDYLLTRSSGCEPYRVMDLSYAVSKGLDTVTHRWFLSQKLRADHELTEEETRFLLYTRDVVAPYREPLNGAFFTYSE